MTDHPSPKGERAMPPDNLREEVAAIVDPWAFNGQPAWSEAHKLRCRDDALAKADAILSLPALSVPEGWVAVGYRYRYPHYSGGFVWRFETGGREINGAKPDRCEAVYALSAIPSPGGDGSSRGLADQPSASRSLNSSAHAPSKGVAE